MWTDVPAQAHGELFCALQGRSPSPLSWPAKPHIRALNSGSTGVPLYLVASHNNPLYSGGWANAAKYEDGSSTVLWADGHVTELNKPTFILKDLEKYMYPDK